MIDRNNRGGIAQTHEDIPQSVLPVRVEKRE
jgi:hypothetical protein